MSPFAFDPTVVALGSSDAQIPRPAAPKSTGQNSFDDHLQQAAQAGSTASASNPQDAADASTSQAGAASGSPAPAKSGAPGAKTSSTAHTASGKQDKSQPHSNDKAAATAAAKDATAASTSTTATDSAVTVPAADAKSASAKGDATTATADVQPDATKPQSADSTKPDSAGGSQPTLDVQTNTEAQTNTAGASTRAPQVVRPALQTSSPVLPTAAVDAPAKATPSNAGGKAGATNAKAAPAKGGKNLHSSESAKSHASGEVTQAQVTPVSPSARPGDQALAPSAASSQPSPAEQLADQTNQSTEVLSAGVTQSQIIQAGSTASFVTTVQTAAPPIDLNQSAVGTPGPAVAAPAPAVSGTSGLVTPPTLNQAVQQDTTGSQSAATGGSGGVESARFVQRVARAFQTAGDQGGTLRLRLSPPDLGSLRLNVTVTGGVLNARVEAETSQARDMLLANLPALRERLAEHNIKINEFDVELFDGSTGGSSDQPRGNTDSQQAYVPAALRNNVKTTATAASGAQAGTTVGLTPQVTNGGLNVVI